MSYYHDDDGSDEDSLRFLKDLVFVVVVSIAIGVAILTIIDAALN